MLVPIARLGAALRKSGVAVSVAETEVALRATVALGPAIGDRAQLRRALRQTMIKRRADGEIFDRVFDAIFASAQVGDSASLLESLTRVVGPEAAASLMAALLAEVPEFGALASEGGEAAADAIATAAAGVRSSLQVGAAAYRAGAALGLDRAGDAFSALAQQRLPTGEVEAAGEVFARELAEIRTELRRQMAHALTENRPTERRDLLVSSLNTRPFAGLTPAETAELTTEVRRLARRLLAAALRRRAAKRWGTLDVARTLRQSLATDGVPFSPRFRKRVPRKPRLVILCDVSDSVRNVSRFMLQLVHAISRLFDGVRAFAFVDDLGELTPLFRRHPIERAVELAASGAVVNVLTNSNYGRAFSQFTARYLTAVTHRSTVIVIGDGRTNYHDPGLRHLAAIRSRAARVWWMNPEPEPVWGFGDSAMRDYETVCDRVAVVGNLVSLRRVIDDLLV